MLAQIESDLDLLALSSYVGSRILRLRKPGLGAAGGMINGL
jgi:hypothetical protein